MSDQLLKTVRITDNIKVEVYQQGRRRKYVLFYDSNQTKTEKYDVALTDDQAIQEALNFYNVRFSKSYKVIQDPYKDPLPVRTYGGGTASPYYLNNGCKLNILWIGEVPNPEFKIGTYSNPWLADQDENSTIDRYLINQVITSSSEDALKIDLLPKSSWVISGTFSRLGRIYGPDYRDSASVDYKIVTVVPPEISKEDNFVWSNNGLVYPKNILPEGTQRQVTFLVNGRPQIGYITGNFSENFSSDWEDSIIIKKVINDYKEKVEKIHGIPSVDYKLNLCFPDTGSCSVIEYKSPLEPPTKANDLQTPISSTQSTAKIKFTIDGLGTETTIKAKVNLDEFTIWAGPIPKINNGSGNIDDYEDGLSEEYTETNAVITDEQQIALDLTVYLDQGDSEGTESGDATGNTTTSGVNTKGLNAGGSGFRRFQQQLTIRGRVVKNGEIPSDLLAKVDFGGYLLEKHAAVKFSALNKAFKSQFGKNFEISGPYRTIDVGINIFDWDLFNRTGACRKKGSNGKTAAAKPGTSKHGWGQAMDIGGFGKGPGNVYFDWMEQNAKKYGWINPAWAKKPGPGYEPWHWEYIGDDLFAA